MFLASPLGEGSLVPRLHVPSTLGSGLAYGLSGALRRPAGLSDQGPLATSSRRSIAWASVRADTMEQSPLGHRQRKLGIIVPPERRLPATTIPTTLADPPKRGSAGTPCKDWLLRLDSNQQPSG